MRGEEGRAGSIRVSAYTYYRGVNAMVYNRNNIRCTKAITTWLLALIKPRIQSTDGNII